MFDLLVIGGGINGCGVARDAAGRGLSTILVEQNDLASATSSASTKLIHGGLRYLEHYDFKLVKSALDEREVLLRSAPHIIWPMEFILPHDQNLRPKWMIRTGLFLYDFLGKRTILPRSRGVDLKIHPAGAPLKNGYTDGFSYADCWADDARLVALCAMDAHEKGASIRTQTRATKITVSEDKASWVVTLHARKGDAHYDIQAKMLINAAGPWVRAILDHNTLTRANTWGIRHSKGSHIVIPKLYDGAHAYILQQPDGRIIFTIPYEHDYTLIGTTDEALASGFDKPQISDGEINYLCQASSRSFNTPILKDMIIWSYSGVRGLLDSGDDKLSEVTRDYKLDLETGFGPPLLNIFGGKLTTFRKLSEQVGDMVCDVLEHAAKAWMVQAALPGGDIENADFDEFVKQCAAQYKFLPDRVLHRYARAYGTRIHRLMANISSITQMGEHYGDDVYEAELRYGVMHEWVREADDFLWRRSKLGLHISAATYDNVIKAVDEIIKGTSL